MLSSKAVVPLQQKMNYEANNHFKKKQTVELSFRNVSFQVKKRIWRKPFIEQKQILHGVNGDVLPGTLTAIMGPSGAGKSTLLNVLAGYKVRGSSGQILINGIERNGNNMEEFLRISCYITQDSSLRDTLTVQEAMMMAAQLKLGRTATKKEKIQQVYQVLQMLGLNMSGQTICSRLSGGQQKRLSIAFELITNPPILFLDEPTTGLDSSSCSQCIQLLKTLARQGRTVLTTIHQPSALLFEMFDNVYALAEGRCIYNGPTSQLVPYLADRGLRCPLYHNPADFLLEVAIGEYGPVLDRLIIPSYETRDEKEEKSNNRFSLKNFSLEDFKEGMMKKILKNEKNYPGHTTLQPPNNFFAEFYYLYMRNLTLLQRNYQYRLSTLGAHVFCSTMLGFVFFGVGNNAAMARENLSFIFAVLIFIVYVGLMTVTVVLPNDLKAMRVEHFNRWFSLPPYYLSLISVEIPMQVINVLVAFPILYVLADMPSEMFRFVLFFLFTILTSLTAQSFGFMMGSMLSMQIGVFVGPVLSCILCVFGFTLRFCDTPIYFKLAALGSYVRSAYHSIAFTLFGFGRAPLLCLNELYCHFKSPEKLLREIDATSVNVYANLTYLIAVTIFAHLLTLAYLNNRLTNR